MRALAFNPFAGVRADLAGLAQPLRAYSTGVQAMMGDYGISVVPAKPIEPAFDLNSVPMTSFQEPGRFPTRVGWSFFGGPFSRRANQLGSAAIKLTLKAGNALGHDEPLAFQPAGKKLNAGQRAAARYHHLAARANIYAARYYLDYSSTGPHTTEAAIRSLERLHENLAFFGDVAPMAYVDGWIADLEDGLSDAVGRTFGQSSFTEEAARQHKRASDLWGAHVAMAQAQPPPVFQQRVSFAQLERWGFDLTRSNNAVYVVLEMPALAHGWSRLAAEWSPSLDMNMDKLMRGEMPRNKANNSLSGRADFEASKAWLRAAWFSLAIGRDEQAVRQYLEAAAKAYGSGLLASPNADDQIDYRTVLALEHDLRELLSQTKPGDGMRAG